MATKKELADPERESAAQMYDHLAGRMQSNAKRLRCSPDLPPEKAPCTDQEAARLAAMLPRLLDVLNDTPHATREAHRGLLIAFCQVAGESMRATKPTARHGAGERSPPPTAREVATQAERIAVAYGERVGADRARIRLALPQIEALLRAHAANIGGRGNTGASAVTAAIEALCDNMGYPANRATIRRTERRRAVRARTAKQ